MALLIGDELQAALKVTMLVTAILLFKFIFTALTQAAKTGAAGLRAPEDASSFGGKKQVGFNLVSKTDSAESKADAKLVMASARWKAIVNNDLENIPFGLLVIWAALICQIITDNGSTKVYTISVIIFGVARVLHTLSYAAALAAPRSLSFAAGLFFDLHHRCQRGYCSMVDALLQPCSTGMVC
eukprot:TRINITY_DN5514_c0_g1_i1.p1 TRINITY_DN5514_c0_g1~~TRINITY_DN5514_c0_g1_i1.p1  ORF type:complete len:184 (-),score=16.20 TRINITY_DN5514_c0_g1_i1:737-1288(-)